jgi:hypothetical protein
MRIELVYGHLLSFRRVALAQQPSARCIPIGSGRSTVCDALRQVKQEILSDSREDLLFGLRRSGLLRVLKSGREEAIHAFPRVPDDVFAAEVVKFAGVHHEGDQIALLLSQRFIDKANRLEEGNIDIASAVEDEQRMLQLSDVRDG